MVVASINLSDLNGSNGFVINGIDEGDNSGNSVSSAGDVNGDGFDDVITGATGVDFYGIIVSYAGESYVVFGSSEGFDTSLDLADLDGSNGFVIAGRSRYDFSGTSVSNAGDVNGDGFDDVIVGAWGAYPNGLPRAGVSYVIFGSSSGSDRRRSGFTINGIDGNDNSGFSVSNAGDVNGDGIDDVIIGASGADPNGNSFTGESYVVFGSSNGFDANLELSTLDGSNGFVINGIDSGDSSGRSVSAAGDVNGDGFDDIIIGAAGGDPNGNESAGESYVVFGSGSGFAPSLDLSDLDGSNGFVVNGIDERDFSGGSLSSAGDVNGDGFDDLIIGAAGGDPNGNESAGESYVVFGSSNGFDASLNLSDLDGSNGFTINGIDERDFSGRSVSGAGDVNGDGIDDVIIGADNADPNDNDRAGESYVVFGSSSGFEARLDLSSLNGSNGFVINGIDSDDYSGFSVSGAGDVNGDGFDDIIIGAIGGDPNGNYSAGESYVVFGFSSSAPDAVDDQVSTNEDTVLNGDVLANDTDVNGDNLTLTEVNGEATNVGSQITLASGALLTLNADGTFSYNPNDQFQSLESGDTATDSFTYTVTDGTETDTATVNVTINGLDVNAPVSAINLSDLNGSNGFVINGIDEGEFLNSVSSAGDVNGDGIDDLIIGATGANPNGNNYAGESYVVFGSSSEFDASLNLSSLDGSNGFVINNSDNLGFFSVSDAGDVNGDGFDDVIIGASGADPNGNNGAGESYVVFGSSGFDVSLNLSDLDGSNGFVISGIDSYDFSGGSVSSAGDVNGDGFDDVIIGASGADPNGNNGAGESYVVFGSSGFDVSLNLSDLDGSNGFVISGIDPSDRNGRSVSSAGDVNGDGFDDVIIGASGADPNGNNGAGESYVVFGRNSGFDVSLNLSDLDGSNGFVISGIDPSDRNGRSVSNAGDVNGDGIDDIIIASPGPNFGTGQSYVVFGRIGGFGASLDLSSLDGSNGFTINGIDRSDQSGYSVSSAGDVNGDGFDDVIIGAPFASDGNMSPEVGESYVVFGSDSPFPASLDLSSLDGSNGFLITGLNPEGIDEPIISVSGAGDVNNDGFDDIIIGTDQDQQSYVVFGFSTDSEEEINGTDDPDELVGTEENDTINGFEGEDTVAGNAGDDLIDGGDGDDVLRGDLNSRSPQIGVGGNDTIFGGAGNDRIGGKGGSDELYGDEGNDSIWGDDGDDLIRGGLGDDLLTGDDFSGGSGSDTFILAEGEGTDTITDFEVGIDRIGLESLTFEDLSISSLGSQTTIAFGDETLVILEGVTQTLSESDFVSFV